MHLNLNKYAKRKKSSLELINQYAEILRMNVKQHIHGTICNNLFCISLICLMFDTYY